MTIALSITEIGALTAIRSFLLGCLPAGTEVVHGQDNRVAMPTGDFVTMTPILRTRLAMNVDNWVLSDPAAVTKTIETDTRLDVQLDVYSNLYASENAQLIAMLFRDQYAVDALQVAGFDIAPLYCSDPRQMVFTNAESQYESRWSIDISVQINPVATVPQQFANSVAIVKIDVEAAYSP